MWKIPDLSRRINTKYILSVFKMQFWISRFTPFCMLTETLNINLYNHWHPSDVNYWRKEGEKVLTDTQRLLWTRHDPKYYTDYFVQIADSSWQAEFPLSTIHVNGSFWSYRDPASTAKCVKSFPTLSGRYYDHFDSYFADEAKNSEVTCPRANRKWMSKQV